jgi:hypothetical protein
MPIMPQNARSRAVQPLAALALLTLGVAPTKYRDQKPLHSVADPGGIRLTIFLDVEPFNAAVNGGRKPGRE